MQGKQKRRLTVFAIVLMLAGNASALPVIPGAVGFGIDTPAGRGGKIIRVTNLNEGGNGSLAACVQARGPRICVFEVSGAIHLGRDLVVSEPFLTIAGQTAPSPGITLLGAALKIKTSNVLVQHIAARAGDAPDGEDFRVRGSLSISSSEGVRNIVIDHCSFSWGVDETVEVYNNWDNVTISNTIISEGLRDSFHPKGTHGFAILIDDRHGGGSITMVGNLIAHSAGRNPRSNAAEFVFVNNVIYNARDAVAELFNDHGLTAKFTVVGNVFKKGPSSLSSIKPIRLNGTTQWGDAILPGTKVFLKDNKSPFTTDDPWSVVDNQSDIARALLEALSVLSWPDKLEALPSGDVMGHVLANVGMRPGKRNEIDARIVKDVRNRTGRIINCVEPDGSARCSKNAGGWPKIAENRRKLEIPDDPNSDDDGNGYTRAEEWLQAMAAEVEGRTNVDVPSEPEPSSKALPKPPHILN